MTSDMSKRNLPPLDVAVRYLSAEWLLDYRPNGGTTVFVRALWVCAIFFLFASIGRVLLHWDFALCGLPSEVRPTILGVAPFAGAVFAFAYTALYARFAAQWSYLANLYNQIMLVQSSNANCDEEAMSDWKAGFIQDALELHLATKPMFAEVIESMLEDGGVQEAFIRGVANGKQKLDDFKSLLPDIRGKGM